MTALNESSTESAAESAAKWDLTSSISPHLDLHMMFPLLEYVDGLIANGQISYSNKDVAAARLSLLRPTHMVDYAMDIYKELHMYGKEDSSVEEEEEEVEIPQEMEDQKVVVFEKLEELRSGCRAFDELWRQDEQRAILMQNGKWNIEGLQSVEITPGIVEIYRQLAKFNYDCGDYHTSRDMLECYLSLFTSPPSPNNANPDNDMIDDIAGTNNSSSNENQNQKDEKSEGDPNMYYIREINTDLLQVLWGRLSCEILLENWEDARIALRAVKTAIEILSSSSSTSSSNNNNNNNNNNNDENKSNENQMTALQALNQRTWLLHWSLFVFWNDSAKGLENMVSLFTTERYLQAVTTNAPHLLRYLTAAVLLVKRRVAKSSPSSQSSSSVLDSRRLMKDLVKIMQHCEYSDPIVEFVDCLCVKYDFEMAQTKLQECEEVLATDFFLCKQTALFMEEARVFVFENYCRIHHKIDLTALGEKLAMDQAHAERWIVDLIRNALLDAKIDSEEKCVVMGGDPQSVYEQVMEKTRDLNLRSGTLAGNLSTMLNEARKEKVKKARDALEEDDEY